MADGVHVRKVLARMCPPERVDYWDTPFIAAYTGDRKMILNLSTGAPELFDLATDPQESRNVYEGHETEMAPVLEGSRAAGRLLVGKAGEGQSQSVEDRLRSWGYC
jgi:hypothetical protein